MVPDQRANMEDRVGEVGRILAEQAAGRERASSATTTSETAASTTYAAQIGPGAASIVRTIQSAQLGVYGRSISALLSPSAATAELVILIRV